MARTHRRLIGWVVAFALALTACADARAGDPSHTSLVVVKVEQGGFRWTDAGVGVVAGIGLSLAACGCLALARLRDARPAKGEQQ